MLTSAEVVYLDSSALVKLVVQEPESAELVAYLRGWSLHVSSVLVRVEVVRAVRPGGPPAVVRARRLLEDVTLIQLVPDLLDEAADLENPALRSLDAIHLATARRLGDDLARLVTYDRRMAMAASSIGLGVEAPGSSSI